MLRQGIMLTALQDGALPSSLSQSSQLPSWPNGSQMNWGQMSVGSHHQAGNRDFGKEIRVLPAIQNSNNNASFEPEKVADVDSIEIGSKLSPGRRIEYLEKSIQFLKTQHQELLTSLHEEVDRLKRKNKELQFCIAMMQQNFKTDKSQRARKDSISSKHSVSKPSQNKGQVSKSLVNELPKKDQEGNTVAKATNYDSPGSDEKQSSSQARGSDNLEDLKLLFLEEELKELRRDVDNERKQNQYLTELLQKAQQEQITESLGNTSSSILQANRSDVFGPDKSEGVDQKIWRMSDIVLPFGATLDPLLVHLPSQPPRPPTLRECQKIARHLQQINNRQAHELNQLKTDLRDVLYSHKWTPDAYLLARAYVADDEAAEAAQQPRRSLPRVPMKHLTRKLPDSAYAAQETVTLPPLKTIVGNQAIERQKRTQCLQKTKSAKHGL